MLENNMCNDITLDKFDEELLVYKPKKYKSKMIIGNMDIYQEKHFNRLHKKMWKILLGIDIIDVDVEF